jgi:hypothetical protein
MISPCCRCAALSLSHLAFAEAADHRLDKCLLQPTRRVGIGDDFGGLFRQLPRRRVQSLELRHRGW